MWKRSLCLLAVCIFLLFSQLLFHVLICLGFAAPARLLLLVHNFRVNHAFVLLFLGLRLAAFRLRAFCARRFFRLRLRGGGFVKFGRDGLPDFVQLFARGFDGGGVRAFERFLHRVGGGFELALVVRRQFVRVVLEQFLGAINGVVRLVARLDFLELGLVIVGMGLGVLAHLLDFVLRETAAGRDPDLLFLAGAEVFRADVQDAVGAKDL